MKNYTKFLYVKELTLLSLVMLSSNIQADIVSALRGDDTTITLKTISALVDDLENDTDTIVGTNATTTVISGADAAYTASTNNLTAISQGLSAIEGTGFTVATDSLRAISVDVDAILLDTGTTLPNTLGTPANTGGTATLAGILGNPGASIGFASMAVALAYMMANVQINPVSQVNTSKALTELTTTVTLAGGASIDAGVTTAVNTYNTNIATAITNATTATAQVTQTYENTATAITNLNTAIANFTTFMDALVADTDYPATVYINSAGGGEAAIKWAQNQLLWSLQQLQENQTVNA